MTTKAAAALAASLVTVSAAIACGGGTSGGGLCGDAGACGPGEQCSAGACVPIGSGGSGGSAGFGGGSGFGGSGGGVGGGGVGGVGGFGGAGGGGSPDPVAPGARPPPDPGLPPSPNAQTVIAFDKMFVGDTDRSFVASATAWRTFGYNLDGILSTKTGTNHCKPVEGANPSAVQTDGENGIDNSFGANLVPLMGTLVADLSVGVTDAINLGDFTLLWRLADYNPGANDSGIFAAIYLGADRGAPPLWNGSESWPLASSSVNAGDPNQPLFAAPGSYVSGGVLVSRFQQLAVPLIMESFNLPLAINAAIVTAQISGSGPSAQAVNGTIAGVIETEALIVELKKMIGAFEPSLCNSDTFDSIAQQIRQASDIMADGTNGDPSVTCNGISIGLGFDARAVQLGPVVNVPPTPDPCAP